MRLDKICRACLGEKANLKPIFNACVADMVMTCAPIQIMAGDGLPDKICTQCLQMVNRSVTFRQMCEKSDGVLREYVNNLNLQSISLGSVDDQLFSTTTDVLQQSSFFGEIFCNTASSSLVDTFSDHNRGSVDNDLADTMQSLQTIAEQCLPETWENDTGMINTEESACMDQFLKCQFCEASFVDEWSLVEHTRIHTGQGHSKYMCTICCKEFTTSSALERHINIHSLTLGELDDSTTQQQVICNICGQQYDGETALESHIKESHSDKTVAALKKHVCGVCGKSYSQNKFLVLHMRLHTGERPLSCELCGKMFSLPSSLYKHRLVHVAEKPYKCNICGKAFKQASNLNTHIRSHSHIKSHMCGVCGKGFSTNFNLEAHMRLHTGEKPYSCSQCDYSFTSKSHLRKHFLRHTGERPYKCWHCCKAFRQKETRDTHVRYHTGERPFVCDICTKSYIAASHLRVHLKGHIGDKKYRCGTCTKSFVLARTLKAHLRTHTGEQPYLCKYCGQQFSQKGRLETHLKKCHVLE